MIEPFVTADWTRAQRAGLVLADVRWYPDGRSGRAAYEAGHVPGAVYLDLDDALAAPPTPQAGRHPLPSPDRFARQLASAGIRPSDAVVGYDDQGGVIAARLVWLLRALGQDAALLDGGLSAWPEPLQTGPPPPPALDTEPLPREWPAHRLVDIDEVAAISRGSGGVVLIDGRDRARYAGGPDPLDPRSGHIPGARSVPARENIAADGRLADRDLLRGRLSAQGIEPGTPVVSYCGSGVTACHNLLVLEHLGYPHGRLYPGSWSQWSRDAHRPIEVDGVTPSS